MRRNLSPDPFIGSVRFGTIIGTAFVARRIRDHVTEYAIEPSTIDGPAILRGPVVSCLFCGDCYSTNPDSSPIT